MILSLIPQQMVAFGERTLRSRQETLWVRSHWKRCMDAVLASGLLLATAPLLLAVMLVLKLAGGRALAGELKAGQGCRAFTEFSLDLSGLGNRWSGLKSFLMRWGIDGLPRLWNVWRGDMSLVGPEAAGTRDMERYRYEIPGYGVRHLARPGLTGPAVQAGWVGKQNVRKRAVLDARYVDRACLGGDLKILARALLARRARG